VLTEAGLPTDAVVHADFSASGGAQVTAELLAAHPDLDGLFAASDSLLARNNFSAGARSLGPSSAGREVLLLFLYFSAQSLFAVSVFYFA
jgi:hypothetical protein